MITVQSLLKVAGELVPVDEFAGPIADQRYIEGAIVLSIANRSILTRDMVDYVDQLWAYLIEGLEQVVVGREFSTSYPDMPLEIVLRPHGPDVVIQIDPREGGTEARCAIAALCDVMAHAGTVFFTRLRPFVPAAQALCDQYVARLAALTRTSRLEG